MKLLVSCGTTPFFSLASEVSRIFSKSKIFNEIILQEVSEPCLSNGNVSHIKLYKDQDYFFSDADLVVSHAGAGTVYFLLSNNYKFVIVPNLERTDKHQIELARFVERNNFAEVCYDVANLDWHVNKCLKSNYNKYKSVSFKTDEFYNNFMG
ncbi:glycosyltransferase [Vibrio antiquarius]|uniref:glycosyltransferase n=1 Tax=Vibrio antiquarius (strain Ex25) TaxID=150340 RepID=UPI0026589A02|nr:glycosyltransferase [Vibrio antiquarius]MCR9580133.1 hypothetical protein [Vibrio antiquarius]MCR9619816.1 hypothetical protein [Vibrio antiquarius]